MSWLRGAINKVRTSIECPLARSATAVAANHLCASFHLQEPAMVIAAVLGIGSIAIPYVVVPIRRHLGLPTYQWDNDPSTHPVSAG